MEEVKALNEKIRAQEQKESKAIDQHLEEIADEIWEQ